MDGRTGWRVALGVVLVVALAVGAAALGWSAYSAGLAQGAAQSGGQVAPQAAGPYPFYAYGRYGFHPFGFGFLGCLGPLVFLFVVFALFRLLFWGGMGRHRHWGWGPKGPFMPDEFRNHWRERAEEWHRQQHGEQPAESGGSKSA